MTLNLGQPTIEKILEYSESLNWQVPKFQRDFVWTQSQVKDLLTSIFNNRPIGLITLWEQPQSKAHTDFEPIKIEKDSFFKNTDKNPAKISLILDGKQRITALAIAFGKLRPPDRRYNFHGDWFLDLNESEDSDEIIVYKKGTEIDAKGWDSLANCVRDGLIPLHRYEDFPEINQKIYVADFYPNGTLPEKTELEKRAKRFSKYFIIFTTFQIPTVDLSESIDMKTVCEIFNYLNTTGTRISTFDLIHTLVYKNTDGTFNLREKVQAYSDDYYSLKFFIDDDRRDFFCQMVTGCYLSTPSPVCKSKITDKVTSIKGGDLLETPESFYVTIDQNISKIDGYCAQFFSDIIGSEYYLKDVPYPTSLIIYLSLRWQQEHHLSPEQKYSITDLNRLFKAFYWRNILTQRYDQGFLTQLSADIKKLKEILITNKGSPNWIEQCNSELHTHFMKNNSQILTKENIEEILLNHEIYGAIRQALSIFIYNTIKNDIINKTYLDRFTQEKTQKVELHHFYPQDWCKNNRGSYDILTKEKVYNCFANLIPMTADSNKKWKAKSPATAIKEFGLSTTENKDLFLKAYIPEEIFNQLLQSDTDPKELWNKRAKLLAEKIFELQLVK
ncbi:DUF262 domain-containing protein [Methanoregula formicica]|uniref:GmrSD restriction endonucleases N-terminal domain-containing protein n=1 Tax=Methanoregula formicica (strain DSM 22288 / NBRC 105244 / SMSP) TaxID=593750 RepID=L0HG81_METFS|nr:DUF262 domain-containing protein [Methanoregula formicica]AGB03030.1 hypothetical protein Metfor_2016 [Methanoregula formicica SMSP]